MENKKIPEFCIDSTALMELFFIHIDGKNGLGLEPSEEMLEVYDLLKEGKIKLHVSENVLYYAKHEYETIYYDILNFIKRHKIQKIALQPKTKLWEKCKELAWRYSQPLYFSEIKELQEKMCDSGVNMNLYTAVFSPNKNGTPTQLAYIMAYGAITGLPTLTSNYEHVRKYRPEMVSYANYKVGVEPAAVPIMADTLLTVINQFKGLDISKEYTDHLEEYNIDTKNMDILYMGKKESFFTVDSIKNKEWLRENQGEYCVDSCVLFDLFYYDYTKNNELIDLQPEMHQECEEILNLLNEEKIKFYITNTVQEELKHKMKEPGFSEFKGEIKMFLENYHFELIDLDNPCFKDFRSTKYHLLSKYLTPIIRQEIDIENQNVKNWERDTLLYEPTFEIEEHYDAKIMAEASIVGVPIVTTNSTHFMSNHRSKMIEVNNSTTEGIAKDAKPISPWVLVNGIQQGINPRINPKIREILEKGFYDHKNISLEVNKTQDFEM